MQLPFKVLAITQKSEKEMFKVSDRFTACCLSMSKNIGVRSSCYIVEAPSGKRMTIKQQREYLSFSQGVNNVR